jgi:hypothetical protein
MTSDRSGRALHDSDNEVLDEGGSPVRDPGQDDKIYSLMDSVLVCFPMSVRRGYIGIIIDKDIAPLAFIKAMAYEEVMEH